MKKLIAMLLALAMALSLCACGGSGDEGTEAGEYRIAMVTDYGDITDQSFNQTTWEACIKFGDDNGVEYKYYKPTTNDTAGRVASAELAIAEGYNVIVMPGYAFGMTIAEVSGTYPDVKFIGLDVSKGDLLEGGVALKGESYDYNPDNWNLEDYVYMDNVYCAIYKEELSGYMAGYAAVKLGYTELGFLGGMAVPAVIRYGYGFLQGVEVAATELGIADQVTFEYIYGNQFYGDADITAVMDTWYGEMGVECVFACGGGIYNSAAEAAAKVGGKLVGVDVDQAGIIDGTYGAGMTITSAMKGLGPTVLDTLADVIENGNWAAYAGQTGNLGLISANPEENYVQIPMATTLWCDAFTQDDYKAMVAGMFDGSIVVSNDIVNAPAVSYTLNFYPNIK